MNNFSLFELSVMANAIEHQRKLANDEYTQRMNYLDRISRKIRQQIDVLENSKSEELSERGFFAGLGDNDIRYEEDTVDE